MLYPRLLDRQRRGELHTELMAFEVIEIQRPRCARRMGAAGQLWRPGEVQHSPALKGDGEVRPRKKSVADVIVQGKAGERRQQAALDAEKHAFDEGLLGGVDLRR